MSYAIHEIAADNYLELELSGRLTREAYFEFVPEVEQQIQQFGKLRMLVYLKDFEGWNLGALWEDIRFDYHHFGDIQRLAIVGESQWEKGMSVFCRPFTLAQIRYFDHSQLDEARAWAQEPDDDSED